MTGPTIAPPGPPRWPAALATAVLLAVASAALNVAGNVRTDPRLPLAPFPDRVGEYVGTRLLYCQTEDCQRQYAADALAGALRCPSCDGELQSVSLAEHRMLPPDVTIERRRYRAPDGAVFFAAAVMTGRERVGIHKAQACLVGQGHLIASESEAAVPLPGRAALNVRLLDLIEHADAARGPGRRSVFAYWFRGGRRETCSHLQRMAWTAWDDIVRGERFRWAYIVVATEHRAEGSRTTERLEDFIGAFYPAILPADG